MARFRAVPASPTARLAVAQRRLSLMPFGHQRYATRYPSINHRLPLELRRSRRRKATLVPSPHSPVAILIHVPPRAYREPGIATTANSVASGSYEPPATFPRYLAICRSCSANSLSRLSGVKHWNQL